MEKWDTTNKFTPKIPLPASQRIEWPTFNPPTAPQALNIKSVVNATPTFPTGYGDATKAIRGNMSIEIEATGVDRDGVAMVDVMLLNSEGLTSGEVAGEPELFEIDIAGLLADAVTLVPITRTNGISWRRFALVAAGKLLNKSKGKWIVKFSWQTFSSTSTYLAEPKFGIMMNVTVFGLWNFITIATLPIPGKSIRDGDTKSGENSMIGPPSGSYEVAEPTGPYEVVAV